MKILRRLRKKNEVKQQKPVVQDSVAQDSTPTAKPNLRRKKAEAITKERINSIDKIYNSRLKEELAYSRPDDIDLTQDQIEEINKYWEKYKFAFTPPMQCFKTYYNRTGIYDPRYVPYSFRGIFRNYFADPAYQKAFQNKGYLPKIYSKGRQPRTLIRRINGIILDTDFNPITINEAVKRCADYVAEGNEIVLKTNVSNGGGVSLVFIKDKTYDEINSIIRSYKISYTVQESIKQHPVMSSLNGSTVNTVRLSTFILKGKVIPLAALIKVGGPNMRVDNYKHGGHMIGVNLETGRTYNWALNIAYEKVSILPSGVDLSNNGIEIPFFNEVVKTAVACHYEVPQIRLIGWDIAIDKDGPLIVEPNFGNDFKMHQAITGPLFREYTDEVFDEFFLKKFYIPRVDDEWFYNEYDSNVVINSYVGTESNIIIPDSINGKPVTKIAANAFAGYQKLTEIYVPDGIKFIGAKAFMGCKNLVKVRLPKNIDSLFTQTFQNCVSLEVVENYDNVKFIASKCFYHCDKFNKNTSDFAQV